MLRKVEPINLGCDVRVEGDHIAVTGLSLYDAELAAYVAREFERFMHRTDDSHDRATLPTSPPGAKAFA